MMIWCMCILWKYSSHQINYYIITSQIYFLVRTFKFSSPSKFQLYNTTLSTVVTMVNIRSSDLSHLVTENLYPFLQSFSSLFPHSSGNIFLFSESEFDFFFFSDSAYDCYHVIFVVLCLDYFAYDNALQVHPYYCKWHNFILLNTFFFSNFFGYIIPHVGS